jgi:hypothetical protein
MPPEIPGVILFSGHMIDRPDRPVPRFPADRERAAGAAIREALDSWTVGPGDICICSGARGGDILFAEACLDRGADLRMFLSLPKQAFLAESVRLPAELDSDWEARFDRLLLRGAPRWPAQGDEAGAGNPFVEANARMIAHALEAARGGPVRVLLLWDGRPGDGGGGTADVARAAQAISEDIVIIDPAQL